MIVRRNFFTCLDIAQGHEFDSTVRELSFKAGIRRIGVVAQAAQAEKDRASLIILAPVEIVIPQSRPVDGLHLARWKDDHWAFLNGFPHANVAPCENAAAFP